MPYSRPDVVSGVTRITKPFVDNLLDGLDERVTLEDANATYARPTGPTCVLFGTSITYRNGTGIETVATDAATSTFAVPSRGYWTWANAYLGQRFKTVANAGVGGNTTTQMLARVDADVLSQTSDWVIFEPGPNDSTNDFTSATSIANITAIVDKLLAAGRRVAIQTITPSSDISTTSRKAHLFAVNRFIMSLPTIRRGVVATDVWKTVVDPGTGNPAAGMMVDATHPASQGAERMGRELARVLSAVVPSRSPSPVINADPKNVANNPHFGSSGSGWSANGTGLTVTYAALPDRFSNEAVLDLAAVADINERHIQAYDPYTSGKWVAGDRVRLSARIRWENAVPVAGALFEPFLRAFSRDDLNTASSVTVYGMYTASAERTTTNQPPASGDIVLTTPWFDIPVAASQRLYHAVGWQGMASGKVRASDVSFVKQ